MKQIALVTGAGSGIGQNASIALCEAGFQVVGCGRREDALEETKAQCAEGAFTPMACDLTDERAVASMFADIADAFGRLDVVFNNAGNNISSTNFRP